MNEPHPGPEAPVTDVWDWHYARSIAAGIDDFDAIILADSYVDRWLRTRAS